MTSKLASFGDYYLQKSTKFMGNIFVDIFKHSAVIAVYIDFLFFVKQEKHYFYKMIHSKAHLVLELKKF